MIIRHDGTAQFLITQPDHAALAARIMQHWLGDGLAESPRRAAILLAVKEHDNGWREVDAAPIVDGTSGRLLDFITVADAVRRDVWPRAVERLAAAPYAAALVAQHALHVYRRYLPDPEWTSFFNGMEALRDRNLHAAQPVALDDLRHDYVFVRAGDLASLTFCSAWTDDQTDASGYVIRMEGERLVVTPDPFAGREWPIDITARELPNRSFSSDPDAARAYATAAHVKISGVVTGGSVGSVG